MNSFHYLFGPVPSRRYGRSLGVDLAVLKACSLNCRFCQLGPTPQTTVTRTEAPPIADILDELHRWHESGQATDFITVCGSGEPTLHVHFGDVFRFVRTETACRSLLLSNGSLFTLSEVRREAALANVVKVSLHAWDQESFERVARPHHSLRFDAIVDGYRAFRQTFTGRLDLEVFIVPGINDAPEQAQRIALIAQSFSPDVIMLNTAVRPPADSGITACPPEQLQALLPLFGPAAQEGGSEPETLPSELTDEALGALVSRHPVSLDTLATTFHTSKAEMRVFLDSLEQQHRLHLFEAQGTLFAGPARNAVDIENDRGDSSTPTCSCTPSYP